MKKLINKIIKNLILRYYKKSFKKYCKEFYKELKPIDYFPDMILYKINNHILEDFKQGKFAIELKSKEECEILAKLCVSNNLNYYFYNIPKSINYWLMIYITSVCISFEDGKAIYCDALYFRKKGIKVISFKKFIKKYNKEEEKIRR